MVGFLLFFESHHDRCYDCGKCFASDIDQGSVHISLAFLFIFFHHLL